MNRLTPEQERIIEQARRKIERAIASNAPRASRRLLNRTASETGPILPSDSKQQAISVLSDADEEDRMIEAAFAALYVELVSRRR